MSKIVLTGGPTLEQMEAMKLILEGENENSATLHLRWYVMVDGKQVEHPNRGVNRTPRLPVRLTEIAGTPRLTQQHLPLKVEVLEGFAGGPVMHHGVNIALPGTKLDLTYSFVDRAADVEGAIPTPYQSQIPPQ